MTPPSRTGPARRIFACSSVSIDYFLFLAESLRGAAAEVVPVAAVTERRYRESARGSRLDAAFLRFTMYALYPLQLATVALRARRHDVFVVTSNTFYAPALVAALVRWRGARVIHLLYDLFPDAIEVAGRIPTHGFRSRVLGHIARVNQSWVNGTVYLGTFLRAYAERRWGRSRKAAVIPIATDVRLYGTPRPAGVVRPLRVHYGGQLGLMHEADSLASAVRSLACQGLLGDGILFDARISGSRASSFEGSLRGVRGTTIGPTLPSATWREHAAGFHIGIVTLSPGGATVCLPSKTYAMMAAGLAILAICPRWSDLAALIEETKAGWVVDNALYPRPLEMTDPIAACRAGRPAADVARDCASTLAELAADSETVLRCRENAWDSIRKHFAPDDIRDMWTAYLQEDTGPGGT